MKKILNGGYSEEFINGFNSIFDVFLTSQEHKKISYVPKTLLTDIENLENDSKRIKKMKRKELVYGK